MFYLVSDRKVAAMVCHNAGNFIGCIDTSILVLFVLSLGEEMPLNPWGILDSQISPGTFIFFPCSLYVFKHFCLICLGID